MRIHRPARKFAPAVSAVVLICFLIMTVSPVLAEVVSTPREFGQRFGTYMKKGDKEALVKLVADNEKMARQVFDELLQGVRQNNITEANATDQQVRLVLLITKLIAQIFHERLNDSSLLQRYNAAAGSGGAVKPEPGPVKKKPRSTNKYDRQLDELAEKFRKGNFNKQDVTQLNQLKDVFLKNNDYPRLICRGEIAARLFDSTGLYERSIETRREILEKFAPKVNDNDRMIRSCLRLAYSYKKNYDFTNAMKYYKKALQYSRKADTRMAVFGSFIANLELAAQYYHLNDTSKFNHYFQKITASKMGIENLDKSFQYEEQDLFLFINVLGDFTETLKSMAFISFMSGDIKKAQKEMLGFFAVYLYLFKTSASPKFFITDPLDLTRFRLVLINGILEAANEVNKPQSVQKLIPVCRKLIAGFPRDRMTIEDQNLIFDLSLTLLNSISKMTAKIKNNPSLHKQNFDNNDASYKMIIKKLEKMERYTKLTKAYFGYTEFLLENADLSSPSVQNEIISNAGKGLKYSKLMSDEQGVFEYHTLMFLMGIKTKNRKMQKEHLIKALDQLERMLFFAYENPAHRKAMIKQLRFFYKFTAAMMVKLGDKQKAFEVINRMNQSSLASSINLSKVKIKNNKVKREIDSVTQLKKKEKQLSRELKREAQKPKKYQDKNRIERLSNTLARTKSEFYKTVNRIRALNPEYAKLVAVQPSVFSKIQKSIPQNTILIQYVPTNDNMYIFLVTRDSYKIKTVDVTAKKLNDQVKKFRYYIDRTAKTYTTGNKIPQITNFLKVDDRDLKGLTDYSASLYNILIKPIESDIKSKEVVAIIPTGFLYYLPFQALAKPDPERGLRFLIQDKQVVYLTSAELFAAAGGKKAAKSGRTIAIGNPDGSLKNATEEANEIKKLYPDAKVYIGNEATKEKVKSPAQKLGIIHFATHGYLDNQNVNNSYILLAGQGEDKKLTTGEIFGMPLEGARLVTLSACRTALGEKLPGAEIASLASAFSIAGSPSIVASLWAVSDESTKVLMVEFYRQLKSGKSKAEAIRAAQVKLINDPRYAHPYFWAPFILIGDWR